jgi:hypothetical protein
VALCRECDRREYDPAFVATLAAGVTLFSRFTIGAERNWYRIVFAKTESTAQLTAATARVTTWSGLAAKAGYGKGRYVRAGSTLVGDESAWVIGGEQCDLGRVDGCLLLDYAQTGASATGFRMHAVRLGFALRFHILPGRRHTLRPRTP